MRRERDFVGRAEILAQEPEAPERQRKGDVGWTVTPNFDPAPLSHAGLPFKNLRGGK